MTISEEVYFTKPQIQKIKELRDNDRRHYRKQVIWLLAYTVAVTVPVRIGFDLLVSRPKFQAQLLKPYGIFVIVFFVALLWVVGLNAAFSRRT